MNQKSILYWIFIIGLFLCINSNTLSQEKQSIAVQQPAQASSDTVLLTSLAQWPTPTKQVPPIYPALAHQDHVDALVKLNVLIGKDGKPKKIVVLEVKTSYMVGSTNPPANSVPPPKYAKLFHKPSIDAVMKWRFTKPLKPDGNAAYVWVTVPLQYQLK